MTGKISSYTAKTPVAGTDEIIIVDNDGAAVSKSAVLSAIKTYTSLSPTLVTPALGTVASGDVSACTSTSQTLVTPALGTPSALVLTNATGLPIGGLANGTDGELITWDSSGVAAAVATGTATHVLTSNGAGAAPTFQAPGGGAWEILASYTEASATESSYTFTPSTALLNSKYSKIIVMGEVDITSALELRLGCNATGGTAYRSRGWSSTGSALASIGSGSVAHFVIGSTLVFGTGYNATFTCELKLTPDQTDDHLDGLSVSHGTSNTTAEYMHHSHGGTWASITSIEITVSTSTWEDGSRFQIYGILR